MKKQVFSNPFNATKKLIIGIGLTALLIIGSTFGASAQDSTKTEPCSAVKYLGSFGGQPVFNVAFDNKKGDVYFLTITDGEGTLLYSEKIRGSQFSKNFKFEGSDRDDVQLQFVLESNNTKRTQVFKVDTNVQVSRDVVVTRL